MAKCWKTIKKGIEEATGVGPTCKKRFRVRRMVDGRSATETFETLEEAEAAVATFSKKTSKYGKLTAKYLDVEWREYEEAKSHLPVDVSLVEAAIFYKTHKVAEDRPDCFEEATKLFLDSKKKTGNVGERQTGHLESAMRELNAHWGALPLNALSTKMIKKKLLDMRPARSPRTIRNYFNNWRTFFRWMERELYVSQSPLNNIKAEDLPKVLPSRKNPLKTEQAIAMMKEVEENFSQWALWHALQLFAGFRESEASRFQYEWIKYSERTIYVPLWFYSDEDSKTVKYGAKTQDAWALRDLPDTFWRWYEAYCSPNSRGNIPFPNDWRWYYDLRPAVLKAMGLKAWPNNARRDSFCTFHMSLHGDAKKTALLLKHRSTDSLWKSYLGTLVSKADAKRYFDIVPQSLPN